LIWLGGSLLGVCDGELFWKRIESEVRWESVKNLKKKLEKKLVEREELEMKLEELESLKKMLENLESLCKMLEKLEKPEKML
jgi:hypothetical protein